jgi:hypothetical protein
MKNRKQYNIPNPQGKNKNLYTQSKKKNCEETLSTIVYVYFLAYKIIRDYFSLCLYIFKFISENDHMLLL